MRLQTNLSGSSGLDTAKKSQYDEEKGNGEVGVAKDLLCRFQFGCWVWQSLGGSAQLGGATTSHWSNSCMNGGFPSSIKQISLDKSFVFIKQITFNCKIRFV